MRKGERTRQRAIEQAAEIFNQRGYFGTSLSDLSQATGLEKGGIYNHFDSKEELALAAFDYAVEGYRQRFGAALAGKKHAVERLAAIIDVFRTFIDDPLVPGGCVVMNTAIESDDTNPVLRTRAQAAMMDWQQLIVRIVEKGVLVRELQPDIDAPALATVLIATLEGSVMLSKLYGDNAYMHRAVDYLLEYVDTLAPQPAQEAGYSTTGGGPVL